MAEQDAVWAETTDGGLLKQLFGYYPTLHDALLVEVILDRPSDRLTIVVDYSDSVGEDLSQSLSTRINLEWIGIDSFELPIGFEELVGLSFSRHGDKILSELEVWPGVFGSVVSESFEARLIQVDPGDRDLMPRISYR